MSSYATSTLPTLPVESGNILLGMGIIIVLLFMVSIGFMFNSLSSKKPWR